MYSRMKNLVIALLSFLVVAALVVLSYRTVFFTEAEDAQPSISQIQSAKQELVRRFKGSRTNSEFPELKIEKIDKANAQIIISDIYKEKGWTDESFSMVLEITDNLLVIDDVYLNSFALKTLAQMHLRSSEQLRTVIGNDVNRKLVIMGLLDSSNESLRKRAFSALALYFVDQQYVTSQLLDSVLKSSNEPGSDRLHKVRTLGFAVTEDRIEIKNFLIDEVINYKSNVYHKAAPLVSAFELSRLSPPPDNVLPIMVEMLEGDYFGDPMLLEAVENYGVSVKPYLSRLQSLELEVNRRILHGRDHQGKGSSTFSKNTYRKFLNRMKIL